MERKLWSLQEDQILQFLVKTMGTGNWTQIAEALSNQCEGSLRNGKQCRQRWVNHLNLQVNKEEWSEAQEEIIFQMHKVHGNKWKEIAKSMGNRTENDIKNRFFAIIRKGIRRMNKFIGFIKDPNEIRLIKPIILTELFAKAHICSSDNSQNQHVETLSLIFKFSKIQSFDGQNENEIKGQQIVGRIDKILETILIKNRQYVEMKKKQMQQKKLKPNSKQQALTQEEVQKQLNVDVASFLDLGEREELQEKIVEEEYEMESQEQLEHQYLHQ